MEQVKRKFPETSYADIYTLVGKVAVEQLGGPEIPWRGGRVDAVNPREVPPEGRLPEADKGSLQGTADHLRRVFGRMGFDQDREIVCLSGAHTIGKAHRVLGSGYVGQWTPNHTTFDNSYFQLLLRQTWTPSTEKFAQRDRVQYQNPDDSLMMLPSDIALVTDPAFRRYVELYASDEGVFRRDFATAFGKLLALGTDYPLE
mmetsp:Transcript_26224/g.66206  ORF Transcript_26224/g.66206 Transcript_26224/m.66206 type:complete len:201 (+) Transcript_26224:120-722(+)|eukprot:CAMPEP_0173428590 /NCGR_PEP_ID=MMETSP1357-20121228/7512_1 /TAXON_ID=77926 /ORGANISM="Hemiselmis rufescens, Strain PCC563" /LENGTH=200 /DNA_ID=CAMNT_0014392629 /DNA_START=113 /DNA_END=715 /DNA_ORIENTATION=-